MKRITSILASLAMIALVSCGSEEAANEANASQQDESSTAGEYTIDVEKSTVKWEGGMIAAYSHQGNVKISEGSFSIKDGNVDSGTITMDMTSIAAVDKNFNPDAGQTREALAGHLMSPDFFDVENHPTATFTINTAGSGAVAGDLTIKGTTNYMKMADLKVNETEDGVAISGSFTFNRQDFGVSYANTMSDLVLSDDVELIFRIIGSK